MAGQRSTRHKPQEQEQEQETQQMYDLLTLDGINPARGPRVEDEHVLFHALMTGRASYPAPEVIS